jgi:hypothetical protein
MRKKSLAMHTRSLNQLIVSQSRGFLLGLFSSLLTIAF